MSHSTRHLLLRSSENLVLCNSGQPGSSLLFYPIIPVLRRHPLLFSSIREICTSFSSLPLPSGFLLAANLLLFLLCLPPFCCGDKSPEINKHLTRRRSCRGDLTSQQCSRFRLQASNPGIRPHPLTSPKSRDLGIEINKWQTFQIVKGSLHHLYIGYQLPFSNAGTDPCLTRPLLPDSCLFRISTPI